MDYRNNALAELEGIISVAWPEIVKDDGGVRIWRGEHVALCPLDLLIKQHGLPYAVFSAPEEVGAGIDAEDTYGLIACEVLLVDDNAGRAEALVARGNVLLKALWPEDPTLSQVWERPRVSISLKLPSNALLRSKKEGLFSVSVTFLLLVGEPVDE